MGYRMGIDVGTASVAMAAFELDENEHPTRLLYVRVRVFDEPLLPAKAGGVGETKNSARGKARRVRRLIDRRARRLRTVAGMAELFGIDPTQVQPFRNQPGRSIYDVRATAADARIELDDLLRVLLTMAKRRGYSGQLPDLDEPASQGKKKRKTTTDQGEEDGEEKERKKELGEVATGVRHLQEEMDKAGCATLGQYLAWRIKHGQSVRLKTGDPKLYARRELVEREFNAIWEAQVRHHPLLKGSHQGRPVRDWVYQAIFYQRPLKSPGSLAGHCPLEPSLPRAPMAQPAAQAFRIEKQIADLGWGKGKRPLPLSAQQRAVVRELLAKHDAVRFDDLYDELGKAGCPPPAGAKLNVQWQAREDLKGDRTLAAMRKLGLEDEWLELEEPAQARAINFLADLGSPEQVQRPGWESNFRGKNGQPRQFDKPLVDFINRMVATGKFGRLSKMGFDGGRSAYSLKALRGLTERMVNEALNEHDAREALYPQEETEGLKTRLFRPPEGGNVVVQVALRQLGREVNLMMKRLGGPPTQIIIELARDLALGLKKRGEVINAIATQTNHRKWIAAQLREHSHPVTNNAIFRYLLWEDQEEKWCPYCGNGINLGDAMNGHVTQIEHILPRTLTRVGRQRSELVLAHRTCNDDKGNRTPFQAWSERDPARWNAVQAHAARLKENKRKRKAALQGVFKVGASGA